MPRFSVSLGYFFTDAALPDRFRMAKEAGFGAVEFFWPAGVEWSSLVRARGETGLDVSVFNMDEGAYELGERGFACVPDRRDWWRDRLDAALELAEALECRRVNVLAGDVAPGAPRERHVACLVDNLRWAAPRARAKDVLLLVEPLWPVTHPSYVCQRTDEVLEVLDEVGEPNVAVQYDVYHAQRTEGDIVATIRAQSVRFGHVQIADVPDRGQPGSGELNFGYILEELDSSGYGGFVGLEYVPPPRPVDPFGWLPTSARG